MNTTDPFYDCLRPAFTEKVQNWLTRGQLINVYGTEGHGIHRLIDDLKRHEPEYARVLRFNMKSFAHSYQDFLVAVADALNLKVSKDSDLRSVINNALGTLPDKIWLCLEYFDRLADPYVDGKSVDSSGYDLRFLSYLNSLKNKPQVGLLICSKQLLKTQDLYIGGQIVHGSQLDFSERPALPPLTLQEIENHLLRRLPAGMVRQAFAAREPVYYNALCAALHAHAQPVPYLEFLAAQPLDTTWQQAQFEQHYQQWEKIFTEDLNARPKPGTFQKITHAIRSFWSK